MSSPSDVDKAKTPVKPAAADAAAEVSSSDFFGTMSRCPVAFAVLIPLVIAMFCAVGWTQDDIIEEDVSAIWIPDDNDLASDSDYAAKFDRDVFPASTVAAMAVTRDRDNIFTAERLEAVRSRMEAVETATVTVGENTFTYDDVCFSNSLGEGSFTTYEFPCARLSPMDFFEEARWFFDDADRATWYEDIVKTQGIVPAVLRFGVLQTSCVFPVADNCTAIALARTDPAIAESLGFPPSHANPLGLLSDVTSLELNHPCRICIEEGLEAQMETLQNQVITPLFSAFVAVFTELGLEDLALKSATILAELDRSAVQDFFYYQVVRSTYADLGAPSYLEGMAAIFTPETLALCAVPGVTCPQTEITLEDARAALLAHADGEFSNLNIAGSPFPLWDETDGTGSMFAGTNAIGGSGLDMSEDLSSAAVYLDLINFGTEDWSPYYRRIEFTDPTTQDPLWRVLVERNPVYAWFMAGQTEVEAKCGNGPLPGSNLGIDLVDGGTAVLAAELTQELCTDFQDPFETPAVKTKQHFARMFYDLLIESPPFLNLQAGEDDPYSFTLGLGCGYDLGGVRSNYTGQSSQDILGTANGDLYYIDEGAIVGAVDKHLLIGGYSSDAPLESSAVLQTVYTLLNKPADIVKRVKNCNRPGGPLDITEDDAEEALYKFKETFDDVWSEGWDTDEGAVQFVSFSDDSGALGTTGRLLRDITLANGKLTAVAIVLIAVFSGMFLLSGDPVRSMVSVALQGVGLVVLSYFGGLGFAIVCGLKINVAIAWTLPFIVIGLGVDDMYIVLFTLRSQPGLTREDFINGMWEVLSPITMTSLVNFSMFAIMNISGVVAVRATAQAAMACVAFLWIVIVLAFPALCWLDMQRQADNRRDVFFCLKKTEEERAGLDQGCVGTDMSKAVYDNIFYPAVLGARRAQGQVIILIAAAVIIGCSIAGLSDNDIGLGLEDFFPDDEQAYQWAQTRTEELASWPISMSYGANNYADPDFQMLMMKQFEKVVGSDLVTEADTQQLWIADLAIWTTRQCEANVARSDPNVMMCGMDQVYPGDNSTCSGAWHKNTKNLREKSFPEVGDTCAAFEGGVCRPTSQMHPADIQDLKAITNDTDDKVWCPVFEGWDDDKLQFCVSRWRTLTGGGGNLVLESEAGTATDCAGEEIQDQQIVVPIPYSEGPALFAFNLFSHQITVDMIEETREYCDDYDNDEFHCWLTGIPFDFWSQYIGIERLLASVSAAAIAVGFGVAVIFLNWALGREGHHNGGDIFAGSLVGGCLITFTTVISLICTIGLSLLANITLTGFSVMSFVLSIGFSVEYSVHVVHRWLHAPMEYQTAVERVDYAMKFLLLPTFMSFISSTAGVLCLAFTEFEFTKVYFFKPLIIVVCVTYFFGCWFLPSVLTLLSADSLKLGRPVPPVVRTIAPTIASMPIGVPPEQEVELKA